MTSKKNNSTVSKKSNIIEIIDERIRQLEDHKKECAVDAIDSIIEGNLYDKNNDESIIRSAPLLERYTFVRGNILGLQQARVTITGSIKGRK